LSKVQAIKQPAQQISTGKRYSCKDQPKTEVLDHTDAQAKGRKHCELRGNSQRVTWAKSVLLVWFQRCANCSNEPKSVAEDVMGVHTVSSRELNQDVGRAKRTAVEGPVVIRCHRADVCWLPQFLRRSPSLFLAFECRALTCQVSTGLCRSPL